MPQTTIAINKKNGIKPFLEYKEKDMDKQGRKIDKIFIQSKKIFIYYADEQIHWVYSIDDVINKNYTEIDAIAGVLSTQILNSISSKKQRIKAYCILGYELNLYLFSKESPIKEILFEETKEFILTKSTESFQSHYVISTLTISLFLIGILAPLLVFVYDNDSIYLMGSILGIVGAFTSVLQRLRKIQIKKYFSLIFNWIRGFSRIFLGCIFGCLVIVLSKTPFLNTYLDIENKMNTYVLIVLSFIAGVSERFVPELLEQIQKSINNKRPNSN